MVKLWLSQPPNVMITVILTVLLPWSRRERKLKLPVFFRQILRLFILGRSGSHWSCACFKSHNFTTLDIICFLVCTVGMWRAGKGRERGGKGERWVCEVRKEGPLFLDVKDVMLRYFRCTYFSQILNSYLNVSFHTLTFAFLWIF